MKKKLISIICLLTILTFTGCSGSKDKIVIYTCQEEERIQAMKKGLEEKFPDVNVVVEQVGTGNLAAKIKTEGTGIEADIILDLESSHAENLKDNFADLSGFDKSAYLDGVNPAHNKYVLWVKNHAGITINKQMFADNGWTVPTTYEDLLKPEFKDMIAMPDPTTSGTGYAYLLNCVNLYGEAGAFDYFKQLTGNIKQYTSSGSGPISLLKQGEIAIAMGMVFQGIAEINNGSNYEIVNLETGEPYNVTAAAIISGRETKENVKEVFQWLISEFNYVDCEQFVPGILLKNQQIKINNFPDYITDGDMTGIDDINLKADLVGKWDFS